MRESFLRNLLHKEINTMKKTSVSRIAVALLLLCALAVNLAGCAAGKESHDLLKGIEPGDVTALEDLASGSLQATDFAVRLFKAANEDGENLLLSPLSVLCALAMTANGAEGETRAQMETVLGMRTEELNLYLHTYLASLPQGETYRLSVANSLWLKDDARLQVDRDFLQTNADYYQADIYRAPFDQRTLGEINDWVKQETNGMIPRILNEIPETAIMYLINALAFEGEWIDRYTDEQVWDRTFTKEDGTKQDVELMYADEWSYLEDEGATGFIKPYKGGRYAFVALLPKEGVTVAEYIAELDGASLYALLAGAENRRVKTAIPKFEVEYSTEMSELLMAMGMSKAFDNQCAEFDGIGEWTEGAISIGNVFHKTYIQVGERGTRAGAATAVLVDGATSAPENNKEVYLYRPFVYMLIDCENKVPFFIGTVMDVNG